MSFHLVWDKGKILSPHEESNLSPSDSMLQGSTTEPQRLWWAKPIEKFMYSTQYDYRSAMLVMFVNRIRKMVSFELDKEIEKDFS